MGTYASKLSHEEDEETNKGSVPSTPILTPKQKKPLEGHEDILDPRSPSLTFTRTPMQSSVSGCEQDTFNINSPTLAKTKTLISIDDPRSPTVAFSRTPITVSDETDLLRKLHKRNLDNVRKVIGEMPSQMPPKLLESSPIKPRSAEGTANRRKSFVGLLETNMDYVETDLDAVFMSKSSPNIAKLVSPTKNELKAKFLQDSYDLAERTEEICKIETLGKEETFEEILDKVLVLDDDGLMQQELAQCTPKSSDASVTTVEEFEKKVSKLIYTDEEHIKQTAKTPKSVQEGGCRTPLGTRNGNDNIKQQKSTGKRSLVKPKLRVSDKPRRTDYAVSKIPVFRKEHKQQCENTPPRNMLPSERMPKRAQWDNDNTLVI